MIAVVEGMDKYVEPLYSDPGEASMVCVGEALAKLGYIWTGPKC